MKIYHITDGGLIKYDQAPIDKEKYIEEFLEKNPGILDDSAFVIGRQVRTADGGIIDLLGMDGVGNVIIVEIKKSGTRKTISQILEYAVWVKNLQYDNLNEIAKNSHLKGFSDLYKKYEQTGEIPELFNQNQILYIVAPKVDEKTQEICRYLNERAIPIRCVEINWYEKGNQQIVSVNPVVTDSDSTSEQVSGSSRKVRTWDERLASASEDYRKNVEYIIDKIKKEGPVGEARKSQYEFWTERGQDRIRIAVITAFSNAAVFTFRFDPDSFDIDANWRKYTNWFFPPHEKHIAVTPENFETILECARHAYSISTNSGPAN